MAIGINSCRTPAELSEASNPQEPSSQREAVQSEENLVHLNLDEEGIALRGYDPVAYFTEGEPVKGQKNYSFVWNDATWYFATAENRDLFSQEPEKYEPANGGYCTFGIVLRKKFDGDPQVWSVIKSRLYVFLNEDVQQKFLQDSTGNLQKVSANWPTIQFKAPEEL
ncbi:MAG: YHS domain-containing (seleno)protein [Cyanobacteria bacterium P01_F01_bin.150]